MKSPKQHKALKNQGFMSFEVQDRPRASSTLSGYEPGYQGSAYRGIFFAQKDPKNV
jgi:hypothetical protein